MRPSKTSVYFYHHPLSPRTAILYLYAWLKMQKYVNRLRAAIYLKRWCGGEAKSQRISCRRNHRLFHKKQVVFFQVELGRHFTNSAIYLLIICGFYVLASMLRPELLST